MNEALYNAILIAMLIVILTFMLLCLRLPNIRWFRRICGGKWYKVIDQANPKHGNYWTKCNEIQDSWILEVEDYSDDTGRT